MKISHNKINLYCIIMRNHCVFIITEDSSKKNNWRYYHKKKSKDINILLIWCFSNGQTNFIKKKSLKKHKIYISYRIQGNKIQKKKNRLNHKVWSKNKSTWKQHVPYTQYADTHEKYICIPTRPLILRRKSQGHKLHLPKPLTEMSEWESLENIAPSPIHA